MQPPRSALAAPAAEGYRRVFELAPEPGEVLVQQVRTTVRALCGDAPLLTYQGTYAEYFLPAADGTPHLDVHDFVPHRDGWRTADVARQVREHGLRAADGRRCRRSREQRLEVTKTFLLGPGRVAGVQPVDAAGTFGFLAEGPDGPSRAALTLSCCGGGAPIAAPVRHVCPFEHTPSGQGAWLDGPRWTAREVFRYAYLTRAGELVATGYEPT